MSIIRRVPINVATYYERTPEYRAWANMKSRCFNQRHQAYKDYGARGITVCESWSDPECGFSNFILDMDWKTDATLTLERIDNSKGYQPDNCYWASRSEQQSNRRMGSRNTSGYLGICFQNNKWVVAFRVKGKDYYLGRFEDPEEAAIEYDKGIVFYRIKDGVTNYL